jgi:hypothetical protein
MQRIRPFPVAPDDWEELDEAELSPIKAYDGSIIAAVRRKATQMLCVKAAITPVTEDCYHEGKYVGTWIYHYEWNERTIDHEVPYTKQEDEDGREKLLTYY